jgi:4'-phosphopantetheinyl transferase
MDSDDLWRVPPDALEAPQGVDAWRVALDRHEDELRECAELLDSDERARAGRFLQDRDRRRWTIARGMLRRILSRYTRVAPRELSFEIDANGKPSLRGTGVSFNLSHSGDMCLVAVAGGRPVGIDVEQIRAEIDPLKIAGRYFSAREHASLTALSPALLPAAFFACWTRKEAVVKALGTGLSMPLESLEVGWDSETPVPGLTLRSLPVGPGYAATVAAPGPLDPVRLWRS